MGYPNVCVVSSLYHTTLGGLGKQAVLLTEHLARSGVFLFVIARRMEGVPACPYDPRIEIVWIPALRPTVHILEEKTLGNLLTSITFSLGVLFTLWRRRKAYQMVHFHGASIPLMTCVLLLKVLKKKVIAKVASTMKTEAGSLRYHVRPLSTIMLWLMSRVDCFIATSSEIEKGLKADRILPHRIVRIPNFVETETFSPPTETEKMRHRKEKDLTAPFVVIFSGRLVPGKGLDVLLRAWVHVQQQVLGVSLILLGDSPARAEYEHLARELKIDGTVQFRGNVPDVAAYLRAGDLFVFPSFLEGFPNALLEAMACGLPVVASRIAGVEDVIKSEVNGLLVNPGDVDDLCQAIIRLLQDPPEARRLGQSAAETIQQEYTLEKVAGRYLELYRAYDQTEFTDVQR